MEKETWELEPDSARIIHCGYPCDIKRSKNGSLLGYVTIPHTHPDFESTELELDVHGGITYSAIESMVDVFKKTIYGSGYTFGFDCAHDGDYVPTLKNDYCSVYRDFAFVISEVKKMAELLKDRDNVERNQLTANTI